MLFIAMAAAVVLCSLTGTVAITTAAAYQAHNAGVYDRAAASCGAAGEDTVASRNLFSEIQQRACPHDCLSVQSVCEAVALMIIALSYLVLVVRNIAVYRRAEHAATRALLSVGDGSERISVDVPAAFAEADYAGAADATVRLTRSTATYIAEDTQQAAVQQQRRLVTACAVVLVSYPARIAFDLLRGYSNLYLNNDLNPACGLCDSCQSEALLISIWLANTPEFRPIVVALSSPLPMSLSLWLMMSAWERVHLRRGFDVNKTEEQRQAIAVRARMGVDLPRPLREVLGT